MAHWRLVTAPANPDQPFTGEFSDYDRRFRPTGASGAAS